MRCFLILWFVILGISAAAAQGASVNIQVPTGNAQPNAWATASSANPLQVTGTANATVATAASCSALCANLVVDAAPGTLYSFEAAADSTLSGAAWWIMIYNATSAPSDGSVTPVKCFALPSGTTGFNAAFDTGGVAFSAGITIGVSTTGCFTKTASTHAFISGDFH